jgi:hypothetical protein
MRNLLMLLAFVTAFAGVELAPTAAEPAALPKAEDVLPAGEVSKGSLVVNGEGFRYQIPADFKKTDHAGSKSAYTGTDKGMMSDAPMTLWAGREAFAGQLAALVDRETKAVTAKGGKVEMSTLVQLKIAGVLKQEVAQRFRATFPDRIELRVMAVHEKFAYLFHCETPNKPNAWLNVGSDCMIRGVTFHVAPPPGTSPAAARSCSRRRSSRPTCSRGC